MFYLFKYHTKITLYKELAQWVQKEGSIQRSIDLRKAALP